MKKILMIASEAVPFTKTGGLAEVVTELSKCLKEKGNDVRIIIPRYYSIDRNDLRKEASPLGIKLGYAEIWAAIYKTTIPDSEVPIYFIDYEDLYGRMGIYGPRPDSEFKDNPARFSLLCRGAFQLCRMLHWIPDVIHCHDWPAAPACYLLKKEEQYREFSKTLGVLTIHNLGYQGIFAMNQAYLLQTELDPISLSAFEFSGALNFLKTGIMCADEITTVSPQYAKEIISIEYGFGLHGLLNYRKENLTGILNGIDYSIWDPETDQYIAPYNFSSSKMRNKTNIKKQLQKEMGLPVSGKIPLVGVVMRLAEQKGIRELCAPGYGSLFSICKDINLQFAILGSGESWCENEISNLSERLPNLKVYIGYNNRLAHMIEAGSDFFLIPSKYEPCGLNQIYSLRYGTLPIVRHTGGLADTVENYDQERGKGTGFVFYDTAPWILYNVMKWVADTYYNHKDHIRKMRREAMSKRFTWEKAAEQYMKVYSKNDK